MPTLSVSRLRGRARALIGVAALAAGTLGVGGALLAGTANAASAPVITSMTSTQGSVIGGTVLAINGSGFTGTTQVSFGSGNNVACPGTNCDVISDSRIDLVTPAASAPGTVDVLITATGGTSTPAAADQFTYVPDAEAKTPTCTSKLSATTNMCVQVNGGSLDVTVSPTEALNLSNVNAAFWGSMDSSGNITIPPSQILFPDLSGKLLLTAQFTLSGSTAVTGNYDQATGKATESGTLNAVFSAGGIFCAYAQPFSAAGTLSTPTPSTTVPDALEATGTLTSSVVLSVALNQTDGGSGCGTLVGIINGATAAFTLPTTAYLYSPPAPPVVSSISPTSGPQTGGTSVTITGTGLTGATGVTFGGTAATNVHVVSDTSVTATSPAGTGTVDVQVTTPNGTSSKGSGDQFTYNPPPSAPTVTAISPTSGSPSGGTTVQITGTGFVTGATGVTFGGTAATGVTVNSATSVTATSPAGTGTVDVQVTTANGTSATGSGDKFTYTTPPTGLTVSAISPTSGPAAGGTTVTITGTGFTGASAVDFGAGNAATFVVNSDTSITATSPIGTGTVDVTVTVGTSTSQTTSADQFTYLPPPSVTSVSPNTGTTDGGTAVTITGTDFTQVQAVYFGATQVSSYTVVSPTSITTVSPPSSSGPGPQDVSVITANGFSNLVTGDVFTYVLPKPVLTAISPTSGPATGGTTVTLTGTDLSGATAVDFGSGNAGTVTTNTGTSITVTSPSGTAGPVDVTVTTLGGTSNAETFTYLPPAPTLTGINPATGSTKGGDTVTLAGSGLAGATSVDFGSGNAATITSDTDSSITVTTPPGNAGPVNVTVTTAGGTSNAETFTYVVPAPTLTGINPNTGLTTGGDTVTLAGTNLAGATSVDFGSGNAATITANTDTSITVTTPPGSAGPVNVTVTTAGGTSNSEAFTYQAIPAPTLTGINPTSGTTSGGTSVTLTGTNLANATSVAFGSASGTITANTATSITVTSPAHAAGQVSVTVTTTGGTSNAESFTYSAPTGPVPAILRLFPPSGPTQGYTLVWMFGHNFTGVKSVTFGGRSALYRAFSPYLLVALAPPAQSAGTVDVHVTNANGTSATTSADQYRYFVQRRCFYWFCFG